MLRTHIIIVTDINNDNAVLLPRTFSREDIAVNRSQIAVLYRHGWTINGPLHDKYNPTDKSLVCNCTIFQEVKECLVPGSSSKMFKRDRDNVTTENDYSKEDKSEKLAPQPVSEPEETVLTSSATPVNDNNDMKALINHNWYHLKSAATEFNNVIDNLQSRRQSKCDGDSARSHGNDETFTVQKLDTTGRRGRVSQSRSHRNLTTVSDPHPPTSNQVNMKKSNVLTPPTCQFQRTDINICQGWRRMQYLASRVWSRWKEKGVFTTKR